MGDPVLDLEVGNCVGACLVDERPERGQCGNRGAEDSPRDPAGRCAEFFDPSQDVTCSEPTELIATVLMMTCAYPVPLGEASVSFGESGEISLVVCEYVMNILPAFVRMMAAYVCHLDNIRGQARESSTAAADYIG